MPPDDAACGQAVRSACRAAGFEPRVRWTSDDMLVLASAVAAGHGIAVLPRLSVATGAARGRGPRACASPPLERRLTAVARASALGRPAVARSSRPLRAAAGDGPRQVTGRRARPICRRLCAKTGRICSRLPVDFLERHACNFLSVVTGTPRLLSLLEGLMTDLSSNLAEADLNQLFGLPEESGWQERALCAQTDPEAFFPEKGGSTREAKKICVGCEVKGECLEYALEHDERFGIWGGLSERERRRLKRRAV